MTFTELAKKAQKFTLDNSPFLLTAVGVTGTVATAYLTGRASFKASEVLLKETLRNADNDMAIADYVLLGEHTPTIESLTLKQAINVTWKLYIPAALAGTATIAAVIGANQIGTRRTAALAAAYSLSERAFVEYKSKVIEKIGEKKEVQVRDEIAQDRVNANPLGNREVIIAGSGEVLCMELMTGRYFKSSMEELKHAENRINYHLNNNGYASLGDFHDYIGLARTSMSDEVGWTSEKLMELQISTTLSEDSKPCLAIDYRVAPVRDYFRLH